MHAVTSLFILFQKCQWEMLYVLSVLTVLFFAQLDSPLFISASAGAPITSTATNKVV